MKSRYSLYEAKAKFSAIVRQVREGRSVIVTLHGEAGDVKGADCWHLACALYVAPDPKALAFLTLDARQQTVARKLGFQV